MFERNPISQALSRWFKRNFSDPEALSLFMILVLGFLVLEFFGKILLPILISIVIAYLLASIVRFLERIKIPHMLGVVVVYLLFLGLVVYAMIGLMPLLWKQLSNLVSEFPSAFAKAQVYVSQWISHYPKIFGNMHMVDISGYLQSESAHIGQVVLKYSLATLPNIISIVLYFILVPILVFFFLKDSKPITNWLSNFLPSHRTLANHVWAEVNVKIGAYVRGRVLEIIIIAVITSVAFAFLGLQYSVLLGALVGVSVIVPYVGAVLVTIPVVIIGLTQWGFDARFWIMILIYAIIITFDANILAPKLFAKFMDLHPVVIIIAVVIFGALWGFWGVFFAIPLAMLINVVLKAWPRKAA
ncbi:MAG: AI-2E family transporter [Gammaproteobacteria bacterium]|nr:AI-2E family transporter [Gammaproteobacteria bacterium]